MERIFLMPLILPLVSTRPTIVLYLTGRKDTSTQSKTKILVRNDTKKQKNL